MEVFVVNVTGKGGLLHYDYHLGRALQRAGVETTLVTSTDYELRDLKPDFRVVELLHLWDPRGSKTSNRLYRAARRALRGAQYVSQWARLVRYLRKEKPDVVIFGKIHFAFEYYFLKALQMSGIKLADIVHDVLSYDTRANSKQIVNESKAEIKRYNRIYSLFSALFVHDRNNYDRFLSLYDLPVQRVCEIIHPTNELLMDIEPSCTPEELRCELSIAPDQSVV